MIMEDIFIIQSEKSTTEAEGHVDTHELIVMEPNELVVHEDGIGKQTSNLKILNSNKP